MENIDVVYNWLGSLSPEPQLFKLSVGRPSNLLQPFDNLTKADRHIAIEEVEHSDFTMDIIDTRQFKIDVEKNCLMKSVMKCYMIVFQMTFCSNLSLKNVCQVLIRKVPVHQSSVFQLNRILKLTILILNIKLHVQFVTKNVLDI